VDAQTSAKLLDLNRRFYQNFAGQFSKTRQRLQPGVLKILPRIPAGASILELGCGNGELARALGRKGHTGGYVGLDFSEELLEEARKNTTARLPAQFVHANLVDPHWKDGLPIRSFDFVLAFAVLHHIPGMANRLQILQGAHALLSYGGQLVHSEWQFLNSPRLAARVQPWEMAGLSGEDVDPGDYLLDWRRGGLGFRYVHLFTGEELLDLAAGSGFTIIDTFTSDGDTGNLGLYQVWKRV
jgi:tRNA (uracil-5-)-methyltransferase TRM9